MAYNDRETSEYENAPVELYRFSSEADSSGFTRPTLAT